jgi:hypothetical protein
LNDFGQCGVGYSSNNVWRPTKVTGLSTEFSYGPRELLIQSNPIVQVSMGLSHGYALNSIGEVFAWGKGDRGQLGQDINTTESHTALPIRKYCRFVPQQNIQHHNKSKIHVQQNHSSTIVPQIDHLPPVRRIASGLLHGAALLTDQLQYYSDASLLLPMHATPKNLDSIQPPQVVVWGKNVLPAEYMKYNTDNTGSTIKTKTSNSGGAPVSDSRVPVVIEMPFTNNGTTLQVCDIACGTHHTAMLCTDGSVWAVGMTTDTKVVLNVPVCIIPAGMIPTKDVSLNEPEAVLYGYFGAHADRTTIISHDGRQVLQAQLWEDPELQESAAYTPLYVDRLLQHDPTLQIKEIHRSWLHTLIVTSD